MKKKVWVAILTALVLVFGSIGTAQAEMIPSRGEGQLGYQAVVLCESLTVRAEPDSGSAALQKLPYGKVFSVLSEKNGWAQVILSDDVDASPAGWVDEQYVLIDPAWYRTTAKTYVYAWDDLSAPKVAQLGPDTTLPVIKDDGEWILVSLRGAAGWIHIFATDGACCGS